jgi:hypothetical protein
MTGVVTLTKAKACKRREPRMKLEKSHIMLLGSVRECEGMNPHSQVGTHFGSLSPNGFPNFQRAIVGFKNH